MLEMVDLNKKLTREEFKVKMTELEKRINELQRDMKTAGIQIK